MHKPAPTHCGGLNLALSSPFQACLPSSLSKRVTLAALVQATGATGKREPHAASPGGAAAGATLMQR